VTIAQAVKAFLNEHAEHSSPGTCKKYTLLLNKLTEFSSHKGYVMIDQLGPADLRNCRSSWEVSPQTANKDMGILKSFFGFCVSNEWLARNPAKLVKNPKGKAGADGRNEQKLPFTDDELKRMYDCAETRYGKMEIKWSRGTHSKTAQAVVNNWRYKWTGRDLADFITVSVYTGLRISDVAAFHINRLTEAGEIKLRTTKTGAHVCVWLPEWVQQMIRRRTETS
jgi:integrase